MKHKKILGFIIVVALVVAMFVPMTAFAETDPPQPTETETQAPTEEPTQAPTEEPTQEPTQTPQPTQKPTSTPKPTETSEPTQTPTEEPTQTPDESQNFVNVTMYIYDNGTVAAGYTVNLGGQSQVTTKEGMVSFPEVFIESYKVTVTNKEGKKSTGSINISRGDKTTIQDMAMGGKYDISVAGGAHNLYMSVLFIQEEALQITAVGETKTPAPEVAASASPTITGEIKFTADFVDASGNGISGIGIQVNQGENVLGQGMTDGKGRFVLSQGGIGSYQWGILAAGVTDVSQANVISIDVQQGATTKIVSSEGQAYVVQTPGTAKDLYLKFEQSGDQFVLKEVLDKVPGEISSLMLGIIAIVVIIIILIVIIAVIRSKKKKKRKLEKIYQEPRGREREFELEDEEETENISKPKQTGGANKFDDRSRL